MKTWLQPPRLRIHEDDQPRHATWLELFYDLLFVVAVSQLAHNLSQDVSVVGFFSFVALFLPVWWAWIGTTFYANRFDSDDSGRRLLMGLQMLAIAALAVNIHHGLGETSFGFALSYAAARFILVFEYLWAGKHIPTARGLAYYYAGGFAIAAAIWLVSAWVPMPFRFILWAIGLAIDFATPLTAQKYQRQLLPHLEHLPERFGLFVIIVLGEAIIAVVSGIAEVNWQAMCALAAIFGFVIAFSLWWLYFENVGGASLRKAGTAGRIFIFQVWLYAHLPLVMGLAATGVGVEHVIISSQENQALPSAERWLMCGSVALCFLSLGLLHRTGIIKLCKMRTRHRLGAVGVLLGLAIAGINLLPLTVIAIVAIICLGEVLLDIYQGRPVVTEQ
ncbi:MAG: low temperature requirement protein A [Cyanophyceae cyanobacterium]